MALRIKSSQDFCTGCAFIAFGAATVVLASEYPLGSAARMGPGYFPTALGWLLAGIGVLVLLKSLASTRRRQRRAPHPWLLLRLLLAVAAFALLLNPLGLVADGRRRGDARRLGRARVPLRRGARSTRRCWRCCPTCCSSGGSTRPLPVWPWFLAV